MARKKKSKKQTEDSDLAECKCKGWNGLRTGVLGGCAVRQAGLGDASSPSVRSQERGSSQEECDNELGGTHDCAEFPVYGRQVFIC